MVQLKPVLKMLVYFMEAICQINKKMEKNINIVILKSCDLNLLSITPQFG